MNRFLKLNGLIVTALALSACGADTDDSDNHPATGSFNIDGEFIEAQTVTATPNIIDSDGISNAQYLYTWYSDNSLIEGNTSSSLTLTETHIGKSIRFEVQFTDDQGNAETLNSDSYSVAMMDNRAATGGFAIDGEFKELGTVVVTPNVADEDGLNNASYLYSWYADDIVVEGNTGNTITFSEDHIGKVIRFELSFTDDRGHSETINSETNTVAMMDNRAASGTFNVSGDFIEESTVTVTPNISDADGLTNASYLYSWYADDIVIEGNTGNTITFSEDQIGKVIRFELSFTDDRGHSESINSETNTVAMIDNRSATAGFEFSDDFEEQKTVTVTPSITDADGFENAVLVYQWYKDDVLIDGTTSNEISFTPADNNKNIHFTLSFTDDRGHEESITSDSYVVANKTELLAFTADVYDLFIGSTQDEGDNWSWRDALDPVEIDTVTDTYKELYYPRAATDNKGNIVVVMQSEYYEAFGGEYDVVYAYSNDNGATFSAINLINKNDTADSRYDEDAKIATDGNGTWVAIWYSGEDTLSGSLSGLGTDGDVVYAVSTDNGVTFGDPKSIGDFAFTDALNESDRMVDIAMNEDIWTIVWANRRDLTGGSATDEDIAYSYSEDQGASWSTPAYVNSWATTDSSTDYFPIIAMNSSGFAVTVWSGRNGSADLNIYAAASNDFGKTWGTSTLINQYAATDGTSDQDYPNHIEVTEDNIAVISWEGDNPLNGDDDDVYFSVSTDLGSSWSTEVAMNPNADSDTENHQALTINQTPDGKWIAVYNDYSNETSYMRKSDDLQTWSSEILLKDSVYYSSSLLFH